MLAAGASTRFGAPKQRFCSSRCSNGSAKLVPDALVVLGAHDVETSAPTVHCPDWELGRGASLRCGLAALPAETVAAVVVLADGPDLAPAAIDRVV